jgi:hypothetical protein
MADRSEGGERCLVGGEVAKVTKCSNKKEVPGAMKEERGGQ